ncbi:hypothetical protein HAX54_050930, partial [Datura stramonium]|nr:hypothetical protein [Datura stramonium]
YTRMSGCEKGRICETGDLAAWPIQPHKGTGVLQRVSVRFTYKHSGKRISRSALQALSHQGTRS